MGLPTPARTVGDVMRALATDSRAEWVGVHAVCLSALAGDCVRPRPRAAEQDDLVGEFLVLAFDGGPRSMAQAPPEVQLRPWVERGMGLLLRRLRRVRRRLRRLAPAALATAAPPERGTLTEADAELSEDPFRELREKLQPRLARLTERQREVLEAYLCRPGDSPAHVAAGLGLTLDALRASLRRTVQALRRPPPPAARSGPERGWAVAAAERARLEGDPVCYELLLRHAAGESHAEIARALDLSPAAVRHRLRRQRPKERDEEGSAGDLV
jgi:DNA-directed RNA polymerase specialized sigma24 family protein